MVHRAIMIVIAILLLATADALAAPPFNPPVPQGWRCQPDSAVYDQTNLYNIIDGAADAFLTYGFVDLHTAVYTSPQGVEIRAEFYRHNSPLNAFGMYSLERKPEYHFEEIGAQGYLDEDILNFLAGPFYVKLSARAKGDTARGALMKLGHDVAGALGTNNHLPSLLSLFPARERIPNGETYIAENFLGYQILSGAFVALYAPSQPYSLFLLPCSDSLRAAATLDGLLKAIQAPPARRRDPFFVRDPNNGAIALFRHGALIGGVMGVEDSTRALGEAQNFWLHLENGHPR